MSISVVSPDNFEQKCLCVLVLDVSGSMTGSSINQLNDGLQEFHKDIAADSTAANRLEISLIEFSNTIEVLVEPSLVDNFSMPLLKTKGTTKLVDAVRIAMQKVADRKNWYKQTNQKYYRPWIILMTDGGPDTDQDVNGLSQEIKTAMASKSFHFFAVGVEGANMEVLRKLSSPEMPPSELKGQKFGSFFQWLSSSMSSITSSADGDVVTMSNPADWMKGFKIS